MPAPTSLMRACFLYFSFCFATSTYAQDSTLYYHTSAMLSGATGQTPFWVHANQNGSVPMDGNFALVRLGIYKIYNPSNPRMFQWSGGAEAVGNYSNAGRLFLSDLYIAAKIGKFEILAGQKNLITGLVDTTLTSGSLSVAGNARPIPRLQLSLPDYLPLYFTRYFVALKWSYSDGVLGTSDINYGNQSFTPRTYFHQKTLYLRFGKSTDRFKIYLGMNHQAVWGGEELTVPLFELKPVQAYWYTISGKTLNYRKVGNHFGTIDLGGEWRGKDWSYFLYRQNIYETGSLFRIVNFEDGLNGIRVKRNRPVLKGSKYFAFQSFLLEVLGTQNQTTTSPLSGLAIYKNRNYFNSYIYRNGWSYFNRGIGSPLIPESGVTTGTLPRNHSEFSNNNKLWAFHTGVTATWLNTKLTLKATYTRNSGSFLTPFDTIKQQGSASLVVEKKVKLFKGSNVFSSISSDIGELYPHSYGLSVGFQKSGFLD